MAGYDDVKISDLFPEAAENYSEPSARFPAVFVAVMAVLSLATVVAVSLLF